MGTIKVQNSTASSDYSMATSQKDESPVKITHANKTISKSLRTSSTIV